MVGQDFSQNPGPFHASYIDREKMSSLYPAGMSTCSSSSKLTGSLSPARSSFS